MKESPLEKLRIELEELQKIVGNIIVPNPSDISENCEKFVLKRQKVEELVEELKNIGVAIDPELVRLTEIDTEIKKNLNVMYKGLKKSEILKEKVKYPTSNWWWYIPEIVEANRKKRLKRRILVLGISGIIILGIVLFAKFYKTPDEEVLEAVSQSYKYLEKKDLDSAEKVLRDILEKYPNNIEPWISLGIILEEEGKLKESEACFNKAKNLCKDDIEFYLARAIEYTKVSKVEDAEKELKKVLSIEKDNAEALYLLAGIYEEKGNINEAIKLYKRIEELGDKVDPQILVMSKVRMGVLLQRLPLELEQN